MPITAQPKLSVGVIPDNVYIRRVRSVSKILICLWAVVGLGARVPATVPEAPPGQYQAIPERNVFGLRPPLAQPTLTNPPAPLPKITLTGITTILGNKRALMMVLPPGLKPGEANKEQSLILTEGQREGEVEVLQIDEHAGIVRVNNSGTIMTLTFEKDGAKLPSTPTPHALPPLPMPLPGATASNPYFPASRARTRNFGSPGFGTAAAGGIPTPTGLNPAPAQTPPLAGQDLTAEEQAIINAFQRQGYANNPNYSPVPTAPVVPNGSHLEGAISPVPGRTPALVPQ